MTEESVAAEPIFIVDDDTDDRFMAERALKKSRLSNPVMFFFDGQDVIDYLRRQGPHANESKYYKPGLILLDLNMPRMNGHETLEAIRDMDEFKTTPIVVLTTSDNEEDVSATYKLGVSGYIRKPVSLDGLIHALNTTGEFWLQVVRRPRC